MCQTREYCIYSRFRKAERPMYPSEPTWADRGHRFGRCASLTIHTVVNSSSRYLVEVKGRNPRVRFEFIPHHAIIVPGLVDSHAHLLQYGWAKSLDLSDSRSIEEVVRRVREYVLSRPDVKANTTAWIEGVGWDQSLWKNDKFPTAVVSLQERYCTLTHYPTRLIWMRILCFAIDRLYYTGRIFTLHWCQAQSLSLSYQTYQLQ
jgi:Amidohydrolase family